MDATKKLAGKGFKSPWSPVINIDAAVKAEAEKIFNP